MKPKLGHTVVTHPGSDPEHWLFLVHGIYGSGRNWHSVAKQFVQRRPEWGVVLTDLRLHGNSSGFEPPHTLAACVEDLIQLEAVLDLSPTAILGHSFGGKVALCRAARAPEGVRQVWVADSTLRTGEPVGSAWEVIGIVSELPTQFDSRDEVAEAFARKGYDRAVGHWLAMNLERAGGGFRWRLDWGGVEEMLRDYFATDVWEMVERPPGGTELHIIRGTRSTALDPASLERIAAATASGRVHLHPLDAGHWLNVDDPEGVLELLATHLA